MTEATSPRLELPKLLVQQAVEATLAEDLGLAGDITTDPIIAADAQGEAAIVAREPGVIAGLDLAEAAFKTLDPEAQG
jgi:nicotinate-nucleotide pyrophosphorylase (carboxylating)